LWREGASLVIVGFQARGTTGRKIVEGAKKVRIFGENVSVKAKVFTIGGFSAHADQKDLLDWVANFESKPRVFLIHGEPKASKALAAKIRELHGLETHVPRWKERLILKPREVLYEEPEEAEALPDLQDAMLNTIVDLEKQLELLRRELKPKTAKDRIAEDDIDRLKYIQEEIKVLTSEFQT
jgi:metallo-beta-lactamase family protein